MESPKTAETRAISYRRVSTDEQADSGLGLDAQNTAIAKTIDARSWTVTAELVDAGISGSTPPSSRPALNQTVRVRFRKFMKHSPMRCRGRPNMLFRCRRRYRG